MSSKADSTATRSLSRAFASTRAVLAEVRRDQLDAPTPCVSWDVRALINHFVGSARWGVSAAAGAGYPATDEDYAAGDFLAAYDDGITAALAAFAADGVLEKRIDLAFGEFSGADLLNMVVRDQFTHGWDLARAVGHATDLDPELADELLHQARIDILDAYRGAGGEAAFGPVVEAPAGAGPADRLAAFLGRAL
ncbi:TIGR03086 family metal-binding protein [Hamadaea tsunoensis]|uniref:TIGR03086 family metal-binding protein n=1 Tax=Hamadaea tsunoensis TaxID=53368 RepID=UPI000428A360|nr:TIGR03086 family metal-binding protein [Hamadaea tsunoensis]